MGAKALEFLILTSARTGEVIGAVWPEIDFGNRTWTVPAERMKSGREHRVPLSDAALSIILPLHQARASEVIFFGNKKRAPISGGTMSKALALAGAGAFTVHGFRSAFRDWAAEETDFPDVLAEGALAHIIGDETVRAYRRGDQLAKRRQLMDDWSTYVSGGNAASAGPQNFQVENAK